MLVPDFDAALGRRTAVGAILEDTAPEVLAQLNAVRLDQQCMAPMWLHGQASA